MQLNDLKEKSILILGYGKEGKSILHFLERIGVKYITIADKNDIGDKDDRYLYQTGEKYLQNLDQFDIILKSPGISPYMEELSKYREKIFSSVDIFFANYLGKVIAITGTKGKSTTSTLVYKVLEDAGYRVKLVGNIGNPVLDEIDLLTKNMYDFIVFEMSSYMLEGADIRPYIGYVNNIYDCHLDWHHGKENYTNAKINILKNAKHKIANIEIVDILNMKHINNVTYFGENIYTYKDSAFYIKDKLVLKDENILLKGQHNRINILGILTIFDSITKDNSNINFQNIVTALKGVLKNFTGLPNRIQDIGIYKGIKFIDDAIATTPESTIAAIKTFEHNIGTLILGGQDSGFQFDKLLHIIYKYNIKNIVLFPDTGEKIFGDLSSFDYETIFSYYSNNLDFNICKTKSMDFAIQFAYKYTPKGKICLLSTAAPSFSVWKSYLDKSSDFQKSVKKYSI